MEASFGLKMTEPTVKPSSRFAPNAREAHDALTQESADLPELLSTR